MSPSTETKLYLEEHTVRLVAAQVVIIAACTLILQNQYLALFLSIDFATRAFTTLPSLLGLTAKFIVKQFNITPVRVFAAPKKFAAAVGFAFSITIFLLLHFQFTSAAITTGGVLIFCAVLESVFSICIGCYVYNWLVAPWVNRAQ